MMTFVQFANDECDYGMGLELGMDLFCYGSHVSKKKTPSQQSPNPSLPHHTDPAAPWTLKAYHAHATGPMHFLLLPYTYFLAEILGSLPHSIHISVQILSPQTDCL